MEKGGSSPSILNEKHKKYSSAILGQVMDNLITEFASLKWGKPLT